MSLESTRNVMTRYFNSGHSDINMKANDVVFTILATGQERHGPDRVLQIIYTYFGFMP